MALSCPSCKSGDIVSMFSTECEYSCLSCATTFSKAEFEAAKAARRAPAAALAADSVVAEAKPSIRRGKKA
jgi:hypothetical protein